MTVVEKSDKFTLDELQQIFLVGGSCYIPKIQEDVEEYFGITSNSEEDRAILVAMGAGKIADAWGRLGGDEEWDDPFDWDGGIEDIIPHDMGIEILGEHGESEFSCILSAGSTYPCAETKEYRTAHDNQESVVIKVYEKTDSNALDSLDKAENAYVLYGSFELTGILPAPAGTTPIEVTFNYDGSRTLSVTAEDTKNHISQTVELHKGELICDSSSVSPTDFILLIDVSGSMSGRKIEEAKKACIKLIQNTLDLSTHKLGIIAFGSHIKELCKPTQNRAELMYAVDRIVIEGSTNMSGAISRANDELAHSKNKKAIIVITDGDPDSKSETNKCAKTAQSKNIAIATIGVQGADSTYLRKLSGDDNLSFKVDNIDKLSDTFGQAVENLLRK